MPPSQEISDFSYLPCPYYQFALISHHILILFLGLPPSPYSCEMQMPECEIHFSPNLLSPVQSAFATLHPLFEPPPGSESPCRVQSPPPTLLSQSKVPLHPGKHAKSSSSFASNQTESHPRAGIPSAISPPRFLPAPHFSKVPSPSDHRFRHDCHCSEQKLKEACSHSLPRSSHLAHRSKILPHASGCASASPSYPNRSPTHSQGSPPLSNP